MDGRRGGGSGRCDGKEFVREIMERATEKEREREGGGRRDS